MIDDSSLPTTRADREAWLLARQNDIATRTRAALRRIVVDAYEAWLAPLAASLTADSIGPYADLPVGWQNLDDAAFDAIPNQWMTFVDTELVDHLGETYQAGQMTAWVGHMGSYMVTAEKAARWTAVANENALSYMHQAPNRLAGVGKSTWSLVRTRAKRGIELGWTNEQLKDSIQTLTQFSEYRADTIARTETVGAYVQGDMAGAEALGDQGPIEKVWVAAIDRRTRDSHIAVHNTVVPFTSNFPVGGGWMSAPHAPGAPAGEIVNCRCYVEFLYAGDTRPDGTLAGEKFTIDQVEKALGVTPAAEPLAVAMPSTRAPGAIGAPRDRLAKGESRPIGLHPPRLTDAQTSHLKGFNLPSDGDAPTMVRAKQKVQADLRERMGDRVTMGKWTQADLGDDTMVWTQQVDGSGRTVGSIWPNAQVSEIMRMTDDAPRTLRYQSAWRDGLTNVDDSGRSFLAWRGTDPKLIEQLKDERVRDLVAQWAGTSNDQNAISLAIQETAKREFGLDDALDWTELDDFTRQKVVQELADHGDEYTAFVHAQYESTQAWLANEGITEMTVYRGMHFYNAYGIDAAPAWAKPLATQTTGFAGWDISGITAVPLRPLSSFTWDIAQAEQFAGGDISLMLRGVIPADRIFATPLTGVGCLNEHEIVVLAGDGIWKVSGHVVR